VTSGPVATKKTRSGGSIEEALDRFRPEQCSIARRRRIPVDPKLYTVPEVALSRWAGPLTRSALSSSDFTGAFFVGALRAG